MFAAIRHLFRLGTIGFTLARHDALFPLVQLGAPRFVPVMLRLAAGRLRPSADRPGVRMANALQALGPAFIKFGQSLAVRGDLLGDEMATDLARLQDRLPPFSGSQARAIVEAELDGPIDQLYGAFDETPVAAASIAQVHRATLPDGQRVAVKVLRPRVEFRFARDLALMLWLAQLVEHRVRLLRRFKPVAVVIEFQRSVDTEMDLRLEAAAASELRENFAGDPDFYVPRIDWQRTAQRVLTLEWVHGIVIDDGAALEREGLDRRLVLERSARVFFNQVFRDGFFHADMHPGNMFVALGPASLDTSGLASGPAAAPTAGEDAVAADEPWEGPERGTLVPVDFGIMGRVDKATRNYLADMLLGFLEGDYGRVADIHFEAGYVPEWQSREDFMQAARSIGEPILGRPMKEISIARLLGQLFQITRRFEMETQPQLLLLQKTMLVAEGVGRRIDPTTNMWVLAQPLVESWMREHRGPEARLREAGEKVAEAFAQVSRIANRLDRLTESMEQDGVRLHPDSVAVFADQVKRGRRRRMMAVAALAFLGVLLGHLL